MKIIELNIGLNSKTLGTLNPNVILNSLNGRGFNVIKYRLVESTCKDGAERCLAWKGEAPSDWQYQLGIVAHNYGQDCIAVVGFIGHNPYDAFVPSLWVTPEKSETTSKEFHEQENGAIIGAKDFIVYLEETLIPDLESDGPSATADDFKTLIGYYRQAIKAPEKPGRFERDERL